ncbi:MAG: peptide transporter [Candidatus Latescibacteria bacterium]|nr:peptide transporter [Candidatus Latescibacterota bacterium]
MALSPSDVKDLDDTPFEEGFNLKTIWGALFVGFVMLPGAIYLGLVTGQSMAGGAEWVTVILFIEIAKRSFVRLRTQEIIILYWIAGGLVMMGGKLGTGADLFGGPFGGLVWDQYLVQSPQATGIAQHIPSWVAPPTGSPAYDARSFLHPDWARPILVLVGVMVLTRINALSLGYVMFRVTSDVERLPFPMAPVQAGGATALAETSGKQEGWRWSAFSVGAMIGAIWGLIYVAVPTLSGLFLTETVQIFPIPFVDVTDSLRSSLPAAILGVGTDLAHVFIGFVLPFWIVAGSFAGSMLVNLFVNPALYRGGVLHTWSPGMTAIPTQISNAFDFWLSFGIGTSLVIALVGIVLAGRAILKQKDGDRGSGVGGRGRDIPAGRGDIPVATAVLIWGMSTVGFVVLVRYLAPGFPWWITAAFGFLWTPFSSYIGARMTGLTGSPYGSSIPFLREASFYLSGYQGAAVWFAPIPMFDHGGYANTFRQMELTRTRFGSLVKMVAVTLGVMLACSFLFWSFIWRLGPIPSSAYPYVQKFWPFHATIQTMWIRSTLPGEGGMELLRQIIRWDVIGIGFAFGGAMYLALSFLGAPTLIFYGFVGGLGTWPHFVIPQFVGAMLGRFAFAKRFGSERWGAYAPILLAGYSCGMGLVGMASIAVALIAKAVSEVIY